MEEGRIATLQIKQLQTATKNNLLPSKSDEKLSKSFLTSQLRNVVSFPQKFDPKTPGSPRNNKKALLDKLLHIKSSVPKILPQKDSESPTDSKIESKPVQKSNLNYLRTLLEDFRSAIEKTSRPAETRVFGCVEKDYVLNISNSNSKFRATLGGNSPATLNVKKKLEGNRSKDFSLKMENTTGPIRISKKVPAFGHKLKAENKMPTPIIDKRKKLLSPGKLPNLPVKGEYPDLDESFVNIESRFNLALKKNNCVKKSMKKKLKTSLDDERNLLKSGLRQAITASRLEKNQSLMIGNQLDSSIEGEVWPEDYSEENQDDIKIGKVDSSGYDNTLVKMTQGSTPNASNLFIGKHHLNPSKNKVSSQLKSFFEESMVLSRKDQLLIKLDSHQRYALVSDYYFAKLLQAEHSQKELFQDHFELTAKSYLLASKLGNSPESFLVQRMVYLPPNPQSRPR